MKSLPKNIIALKKIFDEIVSEESLKASGQRSIESFLNNLKKECDLQLEIIGHHDAINKLKSSAPKKPIRKARPIKSTSKKVVDDEWEDVTPRPPKKAREQWIDEPVKKKRATRKAVQLSLPLGVR